MVWQFTNLYADFNQQSLLQFTPINLSFDKILGKWCAGEKTNRVALN